MSDAATTPRENKMGVMPVGKLLVTMSLPMVISMLVQALYNIVDSMFVARLSEEALTAVSLAFPVQNLMIGIATGTGVGVNALLSKSLGEKNYDNANRTATNSVFLAVLSSVVIALFGIFFARQFFLIQTQNPAIVEDGAVYLRICCICSFAVYFQIAFEKLLQSTGLTVYSMVAQLVGAITNIILDPVMIFGLLGFPRLGVAGAALATVVGQIVGAITAIVLTLRKNHEIKLSFRGFRPDGFIIKRIYAVGAPSIVMASLGSVMNFSINKILIAFTSTATAVFGVYFKLQSFVFMPVFGINNGMVPIVSYNYGARKPDRMMKTLRLSMIYATCIMLAGLAAFQLFTPQLLAIFEASDNMMAIGLPALRTISTHFVFAGLCIVTISFCQSLGHGLASLIISTIRQLVMLLPLAFIFSRIWGVQGVWYAYPVAEAVTMVLAMLFLRKIYRKEVQPLYENFSPE